MEDYLWGVVGGIFNIGGLAVLVESTGNFTTNKLRLALGLGSMGLTVGVSRKVSHKEYALGLLTPSTMICTGTLAFHLLTAKNPAHIPILRGPLDGITMSLALSAISGGPALLLIVLEWMFSVN